MRTQPCQQGERVAALDAALIQRVFGDVVAEVGGVGAFRAERRIVVPSCAEKRR
jgi:hypothetical protein